MKTEIQILKANDIEQLNELITVFENVFEMEKYEQPNQTHLQNLLNKDNFSAVIAKAKNKIISALTLYVLDQIIL